MVDLDRVYLYRMTHIDNVPHILEHGITHKNSANANPDFVPIGASSLIATRNVYVLNNRKKLGDYIPFYFGVRMPMLYVIQKGFNSVPKIPPQYIVYCMSSVAKILETNLDFVFTDGHAVDSFSEQYTKSNIQDIEDIIDRKAIKAKYWNQLDLDLKRRKQAEFLVLGDIPVTAILGFIVYNISAQDTLQEKMDTPIDIKINREAYF